MLAACARMNVRHDGPLRRGAGGTPVASEHVAHRRLRDRAAELDQLADDAPMAPAWVLAREAHDQSDHVRIERRSARSAPLVGPAAPDHPAMPAQQRLRPNSERLRPACTRENAAERSEQRPIARLVARTGRLSAQDAELVAQHEDLDLLALTRATEQDQQLEDPAKRQIQEREHAPTSARGTKRASYVTNLTPGRPPSRPGTREGFWALRPSAGGIRSVVTASFVLPH